MRTVLSRAGAKSSSLAGQRVVQAHASCDGSVAVRGHVSERRPLRGAGRRSSISSAARDLAKSGRPRRSSRRRGAPDAIARGRRRRASRPPTRCRRRPAARRFGQPDGPGHAPTRSASISSESRRRRTGRARKRIVSDTASGFYSESRSNSTRARWQSAAICARSSVDALEAPLVAQPLHEADAERRAVEIAVEVEDVRLDDGPARLRRTWAGRRCWSPTDARSPSIRDRRRIDAVRRQQLVLGRTGWRSETRSSGPAGRPRTTVPSMTYWWPSSAPASSTRPSLTSRRMRVLLTTKSL